MKYALETTDMGEFRSFQEFWMSLPLDMREKMNIHDCELVWMSRANDIRQARLEGRKAALKELIHEFESHDYFSQAGMARAFYRSDISYTGDYDEQH